MPPTLIKQLTKQQVIKEARAVAKGYCYSAPVSSRMLDEQGMFSKTAIITLEDGSEVVVQLKDNEIDTTKTALARGLLGEIVPFTFAARAPNVHFAYVIDLVKGVMWAKRSCSMEQDCHVISQLGSLLPRCLINTDSTGVVDFFVIPHLKRILLTEDISHAKLREKIQVLLDDCEGLKKLPLALCHIDLNARNILLDENYDIAGIVDWEQAALLPLGSNAWCIRLLSVGTVRGKDVISEKSQPMAEAFWKSFLTGMPKSLYPNLPAIVTAMQVGLLLFLYFGSGGPDEDKLPQVIDRLEWLEKTFTVMFTALQN